MLHKIIANEIINLEHDVDCPPFDKQSSNVYCMHHALKSLGNKYWYALNNANRLKGYLSLRYGYVNKNLIDLHNGIQILKILSPIQTHTVGVFPADQIPRLWTKPTAFIINTDDHTKPGMHWVAFYVDKFSNGLYTDSFGLPPIISDHINRLRKNSKTFRWNAIQLQNDGSDVCGKYCIMFLYYMSHGLGFKKFLDNFSENLEKNDNVVMS